ncbi:MAG: NADH-quinone oxidoreductase subunit L, partial [Planctomycetota bacterium]
MFAHDLPAAAVWILLAPALAAVIQNFFGRLLPRRGDWLVVGGMAVSCILAVGTMLAWVGLEPGHWFEGSVPWLALGGGITFDVGIVVDGLTAAMLVVVTLVSLVIFLFSIGYMHGDEAYHRFFFWLSFFATSMLLLVVADDLLML